MVHEVSISAHFRISVFRSPAVGIGPGGTRRLGLDRRAVFRTIVGPARIGPIIGLAAAKSIKNWKLAFYILARSLSA